MDERKRPFFYIRLVYCCNAENRMKYLKDKGIKLRSMCAQCTKGIIVIATNNVETILLLARTHSMKTKRKKNKPAEREWKERNRKEKKKKINNNVPWAHQGWFNFNVYAHSDCYFGSLHHIADIYR